MLCIDGGMGSLWWILAGFSGYKTFDLQLDTMMSEYSSSDMYPGIQPEYLLAEKAVAGSACVFSVIGALLVIFSFLYDN